MGWTEIEEMLEAGSELGGDEQVTSTEPLPDWEIMDMEGDTMRHPNVLEKVQITRSKDLRNAAGFFVRALEKDYRQPVANKKPALCLNAPMC
jgi:hypothetical protein